MNEGLIAELHATRAATMQGTPYARTKAGRDLKRLEDAGRAGAVTIARRLEDGYQRIEHGIEDGQDVTQWEAFWVDLLGDYERLMDASGQNTGRWDLPTFTLEAMP